MRRLDPKRRETLKARLRVAEAEAEAEGRTLTRYALRRLFPWEAPSLLQVLLAEVRAAIEAAPLPAPGPPAPVVEPGVRVGVKGTRGLNGDTPEERDEVAARTREILAEKLARGEEPARRPLSLADRLRRLRLEPELLERGEP